MKPFIKSIGLSCILFFSFHTITKAQQKYKGLPEDLNTSKIIFLKHDSISVPQAEPKERDEKVKYAYMKQHNVNVPVSNKQLMESSQEYPFEYVLAYRDEIDKYKSLGYKYLLDFKPFVDLRQGIRQANSKTIVEFPLYIQDLKNDDIYIVDYISESFTYYYTGIMKKTLVKEVKKKYKI